MVTPSTSIGVEGKALSRNDSCIEQAVRSTNPCVLSRTSLSRSGQLRGSGPVAAYLYHFVAFLLKLNYAVEPGPEGRAGL